MNETLNNVDLIRSAAAPSAVLSNGSGRGTPLADQIQFSSLLKTFVETPQEALAAAQGPKKNFERSGGAGRLDDIGRERSFSRSDTNNRLSRPDLHSEKIPVQEMPRNLSNDEKPKLASVTKEALGGGPTKYSEGNQIEQAGTQSNGASLGPRVKGNDFLSLADKPGLRPIEAPKFGRNFTNIAFSDQSIQNMKPGASSNSNLNVQINSKTAADTLPLALTDHEFTNIAEDPRPGATKNLNKGGVRANPHTAADTLVNRQAHDLAQRLGQGTQIQVQVAVTNTTGKQRSTPGQALAGGMQFATLGLFSESDNGPGKSLQRAGPNIMIDRQAPNNHIGLQNNGAAANGQPDATAAGFAQAVRAQGQALGGQQAANAAALAPKAAPIAADTANISNINGAGGPGQLSQMNKANAASAPRQPQKPPAPMEQVSVQIQRAVAQGADRINIKLHPAHLGRVEVRLDIAADGQLSAVIMAEKPETLELLQRDIKGLEKALQQAGLGTDSDSFNFGLKQKSGQQDDPGREQDNGEGKMQSGQADNQSDETDHGNLMKQYEYGRNLSTNGGIDIRV